MAGQNSGHRRGPGALAERHGHQQCEGSATASRKLQLPAEPARPHPGRHVHLQCGRCPAAGYRPLTTGKGDEDPGTLHHHGRCGTEGVEPERHWPLRPQSGAGAGSRRHGCFGTPASGDSRCGRSNPCQPAPRAGAKAELVRNLGVPGKTTTATATTTERTKEHGEKRAEIKELWDRLVKAGAQPVGSDALELWRIMQGIPRYGQDIRERDLPPETEQNQALNFTKGCYVGQEIVERIRSRGQVHRKFTGFEFQDSLPQPGKFEEQGRVMGEITSVAEISGKKVGLGYVRRETGVPGAKFNIGGTVATIMNLPFEINT